MKTTTCSRLGLVEAMRDGRLGPADAVAMDRHLATCGECRALAVDLERISVAIREPAPRVSQLEHQRARTSLLERASLTPAVAAPRTPVYAYLAAAAVLVLATAGAFAAGRSSATPERAAVAAHLHLAERLAARKTTLRPSDQARFERTAEAGVDVVTLTEGELDVVRSPLAVGQRFVVRTKDAEIEVRATSFRVEAADGKVRGVAVAEGSVEVRYAGFTAVIPAGGSWRASEGEGAGAKATPTPPIDPSAVVSPKPPAPPPTAIAALAPAPERAATPRLAARTREPVAAPKNVEPVATPPAEKPVEAPRGPSAEAREFADAVGAVGRGDYGAAAARLDAFAAAHPKDARADDADYLRAVALQRAGKADEARSAARRYLGAHPEGAHRVEARAIAGE